MADHQVEPKIFGEWLPESNYELDVSMPGFDRYPPGTGSADAPVSIHIPVRRKR